MIKYATLREDNKLNISDIRPKQHSPAQFEPILNACVHEDVREGILVAVEDVREGILVVVREVAVVVGGRGADVV